MGQYLDKPKVEKIHTYSGHSQKIKYGAAAMQGWRMEMEDAHQVCESIPDLTDHQFLAVYDGHGGQLTAEYAGDKMLEILMATPQFKEYKETYKQNNNNVDIIEKLSVLMGQAMQQAYLDFDVQFQEYLTMMKNTQDRGTDTSGCTAISCVMSPTHIIACNAGDSRCVLGQSNGSVIPLSFDHKPYNPEEKERIEKAGGYVQMQRVMGDLALSRALGDFMYKDVHGLDPKLQKVTAWGEIHIHSRNPSLDETLILACDGVWDVCENEDIVAWFHELVVTEGETDMQLVAEELLDHCLGKQSKDNISAIVIAFDDACKYGSQGTGVMGRRAEREAFLRQEELRQNGGSGGGKPNNF